ncbi:leucine-rich repeat flightless-interacting protein 2-like [Pseudoliparis swirei]|uniref:leucine-rich repeat flightless-interacting protein 2-like n=1 Tax=Pseudoliparis swirei TaxID=2059687 RepID=UPI0024BD64F1|nr:leucine-rich repeat flightless-interacting protein 2-like [Pseudoliparis swirei]
MEDSAAGRTAMGPQGPGGRKRVPNQEKRTAEDETLNQVAREAEARLAARRAARAEAREIRMKELERQHREVGSYCEKHQRQLSLSHQKHYGLDNKWGHIEQWMEDSERYARPPRRHTSMSDDEERMSVGSRSSLRPSDYSGFLGSSSRASSRAGSARASPVVEERPDRDFMDKGSRTAFTLSAATLASLGGASSRRGSCDTSLSVETEASIRGMKDSLAQAEDRFRKAMVSSAQLHNQKSTLMYQVENLKEELGDMEELLWESRRLWEDRTKELERERQARLLLQLQFTEMEETVRRCEEGLKEVSDLRLRSSSYSQEVSELQEVLQWKEKKMEALERQREISDIVQIERDRLRNDVVRLRDLLKKHGVTVSPEFSSNGEAAPGEAVDDDVSAESAPRLAESTLGLKTLCEDRETLTARRDQNPGGRDQNPWCVRPRRPGRVMDSKKLHRELRSALDRIGELELSNVRLSRRLDKLKASRSALLAPP